MGNAVLVRPMFTIVGTCAFVCTISSTPALSGEKQGWMSPGGELYIAVGLGVMNFDNDPAAARARMDSMVVHNAPFDVGYSVEAGVFAVKAISIGFRYEKRSSEYSRESQGFVGPYEVTVDEAKLTETLLDLRAWLPPRRGVLLGVAGGRGKARLTRSEPSNDTWEQSGSVFEFYAGGQFVRGKADDNGFLIIVRAGYVVADYGTVEGSSPGDPAQLDMSGWFLDVAIGGLLVTRSSN